MKVSYSKYQDSFGITLEAENDGDRVFLGIMENRHDKEDLKITFEKPSNDDRDGASPFKMGIDSIRGGAL